MQYSSFNRLNNNQLNEPMFFGNPVNLSRFDQQKHPIFEQLTEKQLSFFWRPEEIDISKDRIDFNGLSKHEQHIFLSNLKYQCLVEGTEVLTKNGWVDMVDYTGEEEILVYNLENNTTFWEFPSAKVTKPYKGKVYSFNTKQSTTFSQTVTPEHRMPYITRRSYLKKFANAEEMQYTNSISVPLVGNFVSDDEDTGLTYLERFIIMTQADGSVSKRHTGEIAGHIPIYFSFSKQRKIDRFKALLEQLPFECKFLRKDDYNGHPVWTPRECYAVYVPVEYNPKTWKNFKECFTLEGKSEKWAKNFISEVVLWDGTIPADPNVASTYFTTNYDCSEFVQAVAVLAGFSPRCHIVEDNRSEKYSTSYHVRFVRKQHRNGDGITKTELDYDGVVSCVTVSTGAFIVRYNNSISVSGNCLLDSINGRSPNAMLLPLASIPELETWIELWAAFEGALHARSYTHIIRGIMDNPAEVFDEIMVNPEIMKRAEDIAKYYDDLYEYSCLYNLAGFGKHVFNGKEYDVNPKDMKKKLFLCIVSINVLEAIRFYVSFA